MNTVIQEIKEFLFKIFGENTKYFTFVCIPASTKGLNTLRYKLFTLLLCDILNMHNAFDHIIVEKDREAKHLTGKITYGNLKFDEEYFKGKTVLLFDDIITTGRSMNRMKSLLENMGAKVIGAIAIGKTTHTLK